MSAMRFRALRFPYFRAGLKFETGDWQVVSSDQVEDPNAETADGGDPLLSQTAIAQLLADEAGIGAEVNVMAEGEPDWKPVPTEVRAAAKAWLGELSKERATAAVESYEAGRRSIHRRASDVFEAGAGDISTAIKPGAVTAAGQAAAGPGGPDAKGGGAGAAPPPSARPRGQGGRRSR